MMNVTWIWSKMTLNYRMIVERFPKSNGVVGGSIPGHEIASLRDGQLAKWSNAFSVPKITTKWTSEL